jgi:hypothetical protein
MLPRHDPSKPARPPRRRSLRRCFPFAAAALLIVVAAAPVAAADTTLSAERTRACREAWRAALADPSLESLRELGACEIDRRLVTLGTLTVRVRTSGVLTPDHKAQLVSVNDTNPASYQAEQAGLRELRAEIQAETSLRELRAEVGRIGPDFRVYLLVVPKTHLVGAADGAGRIVDRFGRIETELRELIDRAAASGKDVSEAEATLAAMVARVDETARLVEPIADRLMPLAPADWNDGSAGPVLEAARADVRKARDLLRAARADARHVVELLVG